MDPTQQGGAGAPAAEQQSGTATQGSSSSEKTFTQAELNALLAKERRAFETKLTESTSKLSEYEKDKLALTERLNGVETYLRVLAGETPGEGEGAGEELDEFTIHDQLDEQLKPPDWAKDATSRRLWQHNRRTELAHQRQLKQQEGTISKLQKELEADRKAREEAVKSGQEQSERRVAAEKRRLLSALCVKADGVDETAIWKFYKDDIHWDPKAEEYYLTVEGERVPAMNLDGSPSQALIEGFPDYLRKPSVTNGGSGSKGQRSQNPESQLAEAKQAMDHWMAESQKPGNAGRDNIIREYQRAKRIYDGLVQQQAKHAA